MKRTPWGRRARPDGAGRRRRVRPAAVVALAALTLLWPGIASAQGEVAVSNAPGRLTEAERELRISDTAVREAARRLDEAEDRLRAASTELTGLADELDAAQAGVTAARATQQRAQEDLAAAEDELARATDALVVQRRLLEDRAVVAFKLGGRVPSDLVFRGIGGAGDLHEAAVAMRLIDRISRDDRARTQAAAVVVAREAGERARAAEARQLAQDTTSAAEIRVRDLEVLLERQQRLLATVDAEHAERRAVLTALEQDAEARQAVVQELEAAVAALEGAAVLIRVPARADVYTTGPAPDWAGRLPRAGQPWAGAIDAAAAGYGIDGRLLAALVWTESNFRPDAVSHAGAIGLAQLMPGTARGLGVDPWHPQQSLVGGARYLATQLDTFGRVDLALAAYNAGPGRVSAVGRIPDIVETQLYIVRVLERYRTLTGA